MSKLGKEAKNLQFCEVFQRSGYPQDKAFMRLRPTGYILNSTLLQDKLAHGFILVTCLNSGTLYFVQGDELVYETESADLQVVA